MLSYRHAFHAGNYADVLKHIVLCKSLEYLIQKPRSILYIDTHAGAGQYALHSKQSKKTDEYKNGIGALDFPASLNPLTIIETLFSRYFRLVITRAHLYWLLICCGSRTNYGCLKCTRQTIRCLSNCLQMIDE